MVVHVIKTEEEWEKALKEHPIVLLDCFAEWCGPCKMISPILEKNSEKEENSGVYFAKIDVDQLPELSERLGVRAMPTFIAFKDGKKLDELVGASVPLLDKLIAKSLGI